MYNFSLAKHKISLFRRYFSYLKSYFTRDKLQKGLDLVVSLLEN